MSSRNGEMARLSHKRRIVARFVAIRLGAASMTVPHVYGRKPTLMADVMPSIDFARAPKRSIIPNSLRDNVIGEFVES